jgi:cell division protein FtsL
MKGQVITLLILTGLVLISAFAVIDAKHESRKRFAQLQALEKERDKMDVEWGQLQLEQSTWATHSRVEQIARKQLQMVIPDTKSIVIVKR